MPTHDIIIVGGGLAGLRAALELQGKCDAAIVCKTYPDRAHSGEAQGGINAAIDKQDRWEDHFYDTVAGGDFLNDQDATEILCREAPGVIREMAEWGVPFNRTPDGKIAQRAFGGQRFKRTCFAADRTGHALVHTLYRRALEQGVTVYNEWIALELAVRDGRIEGVWAMNTVTSEMEYISSHAIILVTGGAGRLYGKTTNPENTGDGMAMAYRAGAPLMDMEMIQFHPTTLRGSNTLLSEAARGEGAYLVNTRGERFMQRYAPDKMELAPRDVVSRAIAQEIGEGRGVFGDSVYLDFRHLDREFVMTKVPDIHKNALDLANVDILADPVPVQPGQHYTMAGIATDNDGRTEMAGLFAAGECACVSVHGANRLGGNSLMETLVWGRRTGIAAMEYVKKRKRTVPTSTVPTPKTNSYEQKLKQWMTSKKEEVSPRELRSRMGKIMDEWAGPYRDADLLEKAVEEIIRLRRAFDRDMRVLESAPVFNVELREAIELDFMLDLAYATTISALHRTESRGAHYRTDYPKRNDKNWLKHILLHRTEKEPRIAYRPVTITRLQPVERKY